MPDSQVLIPATLASALVFGMVPALLAGLRVHWARHLGIEEKRAGALAAAFHLALVPMMLVGGVALDKWGAVEGIIVGSVLLALGLAALAVSRSIVQALAPIFLVGGAGACLGIGGCILMPQAFFPGNPLAAACFGTLFMALGALLTPPLAEKAIGRWGLQKTLLGLALVALLPGVIASLTPWGETSRGAAPWSRGFDSPYLWLAALAALLYTPLENRLAAWSTRYLTHMGHHPNLASVLTTCFWLSFLISRLGAAILSAQGLVLEDPEPWIVFLLALGTAIVLGNMAGMVTPRSAGVGMILVGAGLGPIFPALLGLLLRLLSKTPGTACGVLFACATLGGMVLPALLGDRGPAAAPEKALHMPLVLALFLAGTALIVGLLLGV
jgi:fucose permease